MEFLANLRWDIMVGAIPYYLTGAMWTIELTLVGFSAGLVIGLIFGLAKMSRYKAISAPAVAYIEFFRGTPLLVQLMMIHFALPQVIGVTLEPVVSAHIGLSLNAGAYIAEIFRGGIRSIERGQTEASRSLGMTYWQSMRFVILPQAFRRVVPPLGNEFIALLKDSSLVSIISMEEVMRKGRLISGRYSVALEAYIPVALIYLILTLSFAHLVTRLERRLWRSDD